MSTHGLGVKVIQDSRCKIQEARGQIFSRFPSLFSYFLLLTSCLLLLLSACTKEISEEDKLKAIVNEVAEAAQKKDIDRIRKHIAKSYRDQEGNDYDGVRRVLLYHFIRAETVSVFVRSVNAEVKEDTAIVRANVILVRGKGIKSISDIIPESAAGYRFEMVFKKEKEEWKTVSGSWQNVGTAGLL